MNPDSLPAYREESLKSCIQALLHVSECKEANCLRNTFFEMRNVIQHTDACKERNILNDTFDIISAQRRRQGTMNAITLLNDYYQDYHNPNPFGQLHNQFQDFPQAFIPVPNNPTVWKDWHQAITNELRQYFIANMVKAIFPSPDPAAMKDPRIKDQFSYAKKIENKMFEHANNMEEYYQLLGEKIYKIQKEVQEKKIMRQERIQIAEISSYLSNEREKSFERFKSSLLHASLCKALNLREVNNCFIPRKVVEHTKVCKDQKNSLCPVCKKLIEVCNYHSKQCTTSNGSVPFCFHIEQKLKEQKDHADIIMM